MKHKIKYGPTNQKDIYNTLKWRKLSKWQRIQQPFCQLCLDKGFHVPATQTDHIIPLHLGGQPFDTDNVQSICTKCHHKKTRRERRTHPPKLPP